MAIGVLPTMSSKLLGRSVTTTVGYYIEDPLPSIAALRTNIWRLKPDGILPSIEFIDHADGANRPAKFQRDIDLLIAALKTETDPGLIQRYHFYLAQTYFDSKNWSHAADHYKKRTTLGGYAEEVWNAQLHYAHCLANMGDDAGFIHEMLKAYEMRPGRAEVLYDLAHYYRERGENHMALLFAGAGGDIPYPQDDQLFVNNFVYETGFDEELSICCYYDRGLSQVAWAAGLQSVIPQTHHPRSAVREQAHNNLYWYLQPLKTYVSSLRTTQMMLSAPEPYVFTNPSVLNCQGELLVLLRAVNYRITPEGRYDIRDGGTAIRTRNFLIDPTHSAGLLTELTLPASWSEPPLFAPVQGLEDCRLFKHNNELYVSATVRELSPQGWCEMVLLPLQCC